MCPAGSSRWCPTPEQLMILEEMYRTGVRTPNASQIQHITSHLSFYGKIEGKNVFYWFQNHKARDRQKLRRKLNKQLQFQQQLQLQQQQQQQQCYQHYQLNNPNCHHHFLWDLQSPTASSDQQLSFYNSVGSFLEEGSTAEAPKQSMNHTWRMLDNEQELMEKRTTMRALHNEDWKMMVEVGPTPCCPNYNTVATKTLELFPITSRLKEECSSSTATSTSYNKPLISETQSHGSLSLSLCSCCQQLHGKGIVNHSFCLQERKRHKYKIE